jgi:dTDP-4-dehydrorhamnose reductase
VIGAGGYVGRHVTRHALAIGDDVTGTYHSSRGQGGIDWRHLDVTDAGAVDALVDDVHPDAVISTFYAAKPLSANVNWSVNALGAVTVARSAARLGIRLVHVSSDAVHSGRPEPFTEADAPSPMYPYGAAKAAAELGIAEVLPSAVLARVSLVNSDGTGDDLSVRERFMLDLGAGRTGGVLFTDDIRCPIAVTDLARALRELAENRFAGVINLAGTDAMSFYDLGVLVARRYGADPGALPASTIADSGFARPGDVRLDSTLASTVLRTRLRGIREVLGETPGQLPSSEVLEIGANR